MSTELKQIVAVAIVDDLAKPTKLLAARRNRPAALAGLWEFPGGKVEPGESEIEAVHRELREELGVQLRLGAPIPGPHPQGWQLNEKAAMRMWFAQIAEGEPANLCVVDTNASWTAEAKEMASKSENNPYEGMPMPVRVSTTILRGKVTCRDGNPVTTD